MAFSKLVRNLRLRVWARLGGKLFKDRYVFLHQDKEKLDQAELDGEKIHICKKFDELPVREFKKLEEFFGSGFENYMKMRFSDNATLYLLMLDDQFGSLSWVKYGRDIPKWMVELKPDDFVIFAAFTNPIFRGKHLWGRLIAIAYQHKSAPQRQFYSDCSVANIPSRRQLERSGFEIIACVPPPK